MRNNQCDYEKVRALDVLALVYYADYFLKKIGDICGVPIGGSIMSVALDEDHFMNVMNYYQDMYYLCAQELLQRRESLFGPEPASTLDRRE